MGERDRVARHEVQHDLHFTEACIIGSYISVKDIKNEFLHPSWRAFQSSIESIRVMSLLPQAVVNSAIEFLLPLTQAIFNVLGKPVLDDEDVYPTMDAVGNEYAKLCDDFLKTRPRVRQVLGQNLVMYNKRNLVNSTLTRGGFYAILEAQVLGVWGAFDAFTTDLCVAVVNRKPSLLAKLGKKQTTLDDLLRYGGNQDWSGRLGELVKVFVRFDSFSGTKEAYQQLFGNKQINEAIGAPAASIACLVRSQIVHDAGIVTENFLRQAKDKKADPWQAASLGERLRLDGRNVSALSEGVIDCANNLIRAVDDWIHVPPTESISK